MISKIYNCNKKNMDKQKDKTKKPFSLSGCAKDVIKDAYAEASRGYPLEKWSM